MISLELDFVRLNVARWESYSFSREDIGMDYRSCTYVCLAMQ